MGVRFSFSFIAYSPKPDGFYAIKFGLRVDEDFTALQVIRTVRGRFSGSPALIAEVEARAAGNKLELFITGLNLGTRRLNRSREVQKEQVGDGTSIKHTLSCEFSETYADRLDTDQQLLQFELSEEIKYSGPRWTFHATPDGSDVPQQLGTEKGRRVVSGTVLAATEDAAMAWVKAQHSLPFYAGSIGGGDAPEVRYEDPPNIKKSWEFLPLEGTPTARGDEDAVNFRAVRVDFSFSETLIDFPWSE
jgi:hypothetical protein